jgi:hypothetical protein
MTSKERALYKRPETSDDAGRAMRFAEVERKTGDPAGSPKTQAMARETREGRAGERLERYTEIERGEE